MTDYNAYSNSAWLTRKDDITIVIINNGVTTIGRFAFYKCSNIISITIPNSVTSIGGHAFRECTHLTDISIPNKVSSIAEYTFEKCSDLSLITIPSSVNSIGEGAFEDCSSLSSITIPESVKSVGDCAFYGCSGLTSVVIPSSVTSIGTPFRGCSNLTSIVVDSANPKYDSRNNCNAIIETITNVLVQGCSNTIIPNSVRSIGQYAFCVLDNFTSINIPNGVTSIGNYAFSNCSNLSSVYFFNPTPPLFKSTECFSRTSCQFLVPCDSKNLYVAALNDSVGYWGQISSSRVVEQIPYKYEVSSDSPAMGSISIIQEPSCSDLTMIVGAEANYGYEFSHWSDADTSNPRSITLTRDTSLTANFEKHRFSITIAPNSANYGSAQSPLSALYQERITLTATANEHYHFVRWSDGNTSNPRTLIVERDTNLTALFEPNKYTISASATNGRVEGTGKHDYGAEVVLTAQPSYGYQFTRWGDGSSLNPRTIVLTQDTSFTAYFEKCRYSITIGVNEKSYGTIQNNPQSALYQDHVTFTAVANEHYHFARWSDGNTSNPRTLIVERDTNLTAIFEIDMHTITAKAINGRVEGAGTYPYNTNVDLYAYPDDGYKFDHWNDGSLFSHIIVPLLEDTQIEAFFVPVSEDLESTHAHSFNAYTIGQTLYVDNTNAPYTVINANGSTVYSGSESSVNLPTQGMYVVICNGDAIKVITK